jgi:nucleoprotein TPR
MEAQKKNFANKQQVAIDTAVAAAKSENPPVAVPPNEEAEKKHADELKALEERLRAEHKKELEAAAANAVPGATTEKSKGADVEPLIASAKAEWENTSPLAVNGHGHSGEESSGKKALVAVAEVCVVVT